MWIVKIKYTSGESVVKRYASPDVAWSYAAGFLETKDVQYVKVSPPKDSHEPR